ncbi:hypothetical protein P175DRAFT_0519980 [Aspergillus ochraceoroseus IBT 24754]|uniref:Uncharacterized protein n=1 Tax=Aspergillus ochraceoroseus IBT 24754 TaxID=1392256 RepID=A0A2T5M638_9EURO|nr:uncharacterized protein P175DRAFT_0519980 [Aspergillus ochraceoroseus IBT 24754]PTU23992.1 hypothetical protein P175DRAFT_0519980 [Aspergillus ochraceoroseus IBT 24754]
MAHLSECERPIVPEELRSSFTGLLECNSRPMTTFTNEISAIAGPNTRRSEQFGKRLGVAEAGFKDVQQEIYKFRCHLAKSPKLKDLGRYQQLNMLEALFTRFLGWSVEEVKCS